MTGQLISVVVPFYNNADLLGECLSSIAAQTYTELEVIMVDDGSSDGSADVARAQAAADPRFRLVSVPNGGPGSARNKGVAAATGEYLAFVDADDLLPPDAYATMLPVLRQTGSDFVTGGVLRLDTTGLGKSGLHARAIKATRLRTHISATPELFYDISVWNKLFRRSFWDASGLRLPEGMYWEDLVAMTQAHVLASSVDVITEPVYHWRDRDKGERSITQSRASIANFRDRITALGMIDDFLRARGTPAMRRLHQHKALVNDLWLYVRDLPLTGPEYQSEFVRLAGGYLRGADPAVTGKLPATRKLAYYLAERGREAELLELADWLVAHPGRTPPMVRSRGRRYADLPFRRSGGLAIPARVFRPQRRDFDPYVRTDAIGWSGERLVIEGSAYVPSVGIASRRQTAKVLMLRSRGRRLPPVMLPARSVRRPDVTAASGQDRYSYDWAGFRCELSPRLLRAGRRWLTGDWDCYLLVRGRELWRPARLHSPGPGAEHPVGREIAPGLTLRPVWAGDRLVLRIGAEAQSDRTADAGGSTPGEFRLTWDDGALTVRGQFPGADQAEGYQVELRHGDGWDKHVFPAGVTGADLTAAIPVGAVETFGDRRPLRDGSWEIRLTDAAGEQVDATFATDAPAVTVGQKVYRFDAGGPGSAPRLTVGPALGPAERGRIRRKLLRELYYRAQRLLPVRDTILFSSFHGKQCGDSPRAVADELRRRGDTREQIWSVSDWAVTPPPGARAVLIGTAAYYAVLGRTRYLVVNDHVPLPYRKRAGQLHAQTWHGTPLKRLGYDIGEPSMASGRRYLDYMASDVAQWDLLLSPNPFATPIFRRAFGFTGEICETGYPRDDALVTGAGLAGAGLAGAGLAGVGLAGVGLAEMQDEAAVRIRQRLGLLAGKRAAMYVPTWRDNQHDAAGRYLLDFRLDLTAARQRLGDDYVLLIRGHHLMAGGIAAADAPGFAIDVTGYPDIGDLLLVTDVLITDYSSVMFDFAPTGRPMLFFTYDFAEYRDKIRGFYFDFADVAPGPLLATSDEVVDALAALDVVAPRYEQARAAFAARFCPLDDGKASGRACDRIFGS